MLELIRMFYECSRDRKENDDVTFVFTPLCEWSQPTDNGNVTHYKNMKEKRKILRTIFLQRFLIYFGQFFFFVLEKKQAHKILKHLKENERCVFYHFVETNIILVKSI